VILSHTRRLFSPTPVSPSDTATARSRVCVIRDKIGRRLELDLVTPSIQRDSERPFSNSVRARSPPPPHPGGQTSSRSQPPPPPRNSTDYDFRNRIILTIIITLSLFPNRLGTRKTAQIRRRAPPLALWPPNHHTAVDHGVQTFLEQ